MQELWVAAVGLNKRDVKFAKFFPRMMKFFEDNFAPQFGVGAPLWNDIDIKLVQSNVRTHIVPDHLSATDTVRIDILDKAFQMGCDMSVNMMNYCRREVKKFEPKVDEHDHVDGEDDAKELANDSVEGCMQVLASHQAHDHICLYALRSIPRHCQGNPSKQVVIGEGHGIMLLAATMRRHEENVNIQDGCMSVMNKVLDTVQVLPQLG